MRVVTVCAGCRTTQAVRAILRTRLVRTFAVGRSLLTLGARALAFAILTRAGRDGGFSATCTAPPPMIAPPQVQAQSLAKAIRTDIRRTLFKASKPPRIVFAKHPVSFPAIHDRCKGILSTQAR